MKWLCVLCLLVCAAVWGDASDIPSGPQALKNGDFSATPPMWGWEGRGIANGSYRVVKPEEGGDAVLMITVNKTSSRPWSMELWQKVSMPIPHGSTLYISFDYKMTPGYSFQFYWQQEEEPWPKLLSMHLSEPVNQWRTVRVAVPVKNGVRSDQTAFSFHLSEKTGVLELRRISAVILPPSVKMETLQTNETAVLGGDFFDQDWRDRVTRRMEALRKMPLVIRAHRGGRPLAGANVTVKQISRPYELGVEAHASLLCPAALAEPALAELAGTLPADDASLGKYKSAVLGSGLFKAVTISDALIWRNYDSWGKTIDEEAVKAVSDAGMAVHAHALFCPEFLYAPQACRGMERAQLWSALQKHVRELCRRHHGNVYAWDVIHGGADSWDMYSKIGCEAAVEVFSIAQEAQKGAKLMLSDSQALTAVSEDALRNMLEFAGWLKEENHLPLDGIVLGASMRRLDVAPQAMEKRLNVIAARFPGVPLYITGLAVNEPKEELQSSMLHDYMLLFYSHPAVAGVSLGELWDPVAAAPGMGYLNEDFSPRKSLKMIQALMNETWKTDAHGVTDENGQLELSAFEGCLEVTVSAGKGVFKRQIEVAPSKEWKPGWRNEHARQKLILDVSF